MQRRRKHPPSHSFSKCPLRCPHSHMRLLSRRLPPLSQRVLLPPYRTCPSAGQNWDGERKDFHETITRTTPRYPISTFTFSSDTVVPGKTHPYLVSILTQQSRGHQGKNYTSRPPLLNILAVYTLYAKKEATRRLCVFKL